MCDRHWKSTGKSSYLPNIMRFRLPNVVRPLAAAGRLQIGFFFFSYTYLFYLRGYYTYLCCYWPINSDVCFTDEIFESLVELDYDCEIPLVSRIYNVLLRTESIFLHVPRPLIINFVWSTLNLYYAWSEK